MLALGLLAAAALVAMIVLAVGGLSAWTQSMLALPQGRIMAPANTKDFGWIERGISQCAAEAARSLDTLYFIVIPVVAPDTDVQVWIAKANGRIGRSIVLIGAQDTLEGLRAGTLRLAGRTFDFAVLELSSSRAYKWKPSVGVNKFAIRHAKSVTSFRPGFEFPAGTEPQWAEGGAIVREPGTCYWTGALMQR